MAWCKKLLRSFRYAGAGIWRTVRTQQNMRIHLVAACYIVWVGYLAGLSATKMAVITLCCGVVMGLELVNTALETLCDKLTTDWDAHIRTAKDAAAGAVLMAAIASVGVALWLLGAWITTGGLTELICTRPVVDGAFLVSLAAAVVFVRGTGGRPQGTPQQNKSKTFKYNEKEQ